LIPYLVVEILGGLVGYFLALRLIKWLTINSESQTKSQI
jgi:hypothetical protein